MTTPEIELIQDWHAAVNTGDVDRLVALSHPDVEVGGPKGTGRGAKLLREWVERANIRLEPRRTFQRAEVVVVEQEAEWRAADGGPMDGVQTVASVFLVREHRIARVVRCPDLATALRSADLDETSEVRDG